MVGITTYNRPTELKRLVHELHNLDFIVVDDGSSYNPFLDKKNIFRKPHGGKKGYWLTYKILINRLLMSNHNDFIIIPDDVYSIDFERIAEYHSRYRDEYYTINMINDTRSSCWSSPAPCKVESDMINKGFFDCGGLTNRKTLELINLKPMHDSWWSEGKSSGVGYQITKQLKGKAKMLTPKKSLAYHGNHTSVMHPQERIKRPLISI